MHLTRAEEILNDTLNSRTPQSRYIDRADLADIFTRDKDIRLFLVIAPAGHGKSTTARLALHEAEAVDANLAHIWLTVDKNNARIETFLYRLVHAVEGRFPSFAKALEPVLNNQSDPVVVAQEIGIAFARTHQNIILVIDDYHNLEYAGQSREEPLSTIIDRLPENVRTVIISREEPHLPCLPRLHGRREVMKITESDLCFSIEETLELLRDVYEDDEVDISIAMILAHKMEGWPIGIVFIGELRRARKHQSWSEILRTIESNKELFWDYFTSEIFSLLTVEEQHAMRLFAELDAWNAQEACLLLKTGADTPLYNLFTGQRSALVLPSEDRRPTFKFHPLLRRYLSERLPLTDIDRLRIADFSEQTMQWNILCRTTALCSDWGRLLQTLYALYRSESLTTFISLAELDTYLDMIPPEVRSIRPEWWIMRIYSHLARNRAKMAIEMNPPRQIFSPSEWMEYLDHLCHAHYVSHEFDLVVALAETHVPHPDVRTHISGYGISILRYYCIAKMELGRAEDIRGLIEDMAEHGLAETPTVRMYEVCITVLTFYFFSGQETHAKFYATRLFEIALSLEGLYPARSQGAYAAMLKHFERYDEALPHLCSAVERATQYGDVLFLCKLHELLYETYICMDEKERASEALEKYGKYLRENRDSWQFQLAGKQAQWMFLFAPLHSFLSAICNYRELAAPEKYSARSISCIAVGAIILGKHEWAADIRTRLESGRPLRDFDALICRYYASMAQFMISNEITKEITEELYARADECAAAFPKFIGVWNQIPTQAYLLFLGIQRLGKRGHVLLRAFDRQCAFLCLFAEKYWDECDLSTKTAIIEYLAERAHVPRVALFFTRIIAKDPKGTREAGCAGTLDNILDNGKVPERELHEAVTAAVANGYGKAIFEKFRRREPPPFQFRCFGTLDVRRDGNSVALPAGSNSKIPSLLSYLIIHRNIHVQTEDILYDVFGDTSEKSLNNFYQVVHRLRFFLEPHLASATGSHLIHFDSRAGTYRFITREIDTLDVHDYTGAISNMRRLHDQSAANEAERAVEFYRGDFMGNLKREDWAEQVSEQYRDECLEALHVLVKWYRRLRAWDKLSLYSAKGFAMAPYDEDFCATQLHYAIIDRNVTLFHTVFSKHTGAVKEFLATQPSKLIQRLFTNLRNQL